MKKFIYTVSFLAIALTFSGTSALAQSVTKIDADIPFDFAIGGQALEAGKYVMRLRRNTSGSETLEIRDARNHVVYEAFLLQNGDSSLNESKLVFDNIDGQRVLANIRLQNKGFDVPVEKSAITILAAKKVKRTGGSSN
jgi:hypothetical protein